LRALVVVSVRNPAALWVIFVFAGHIAESRVGPSEEGELAWVELDALSAVSLPPDVPLLLPHLFTAGEVLVVRAEYGTEDPKTLSRLEVVGS